MIIVCMVLPRPFAVRPSSKENGFVTIHDVLAATQAAFRQAAQGDERWVSGVSR
jgi:hypothetical protein